MFDVFFFSAAEEGTHVQSLCSGKIFGQTDSQTDRQRTLSIIIVSFFQAVVQTVDNLLGPEALVSWADLSSVDQSRSASLLLDAVEKGAFLLANNLYEGRFSDRAPNVGKWDISQLFASIHVATMTTWSRHIYTSLPVWTDLEVYVLNTEADIQDLTFPHSYDSDSILQISALALQQYSNNGL